MKVIEQPLGFCPICDKKSHILEKLNIESHYKILCENEFYKHIVTEHGVDGIHKKRNPKNNLSK